MTLDNIRKIFDEASHRLPGSPETQALIDGWRDLLGRIEALAKALLTTMADAAPADPDARRLASMYDTARVSADRAAEIDRAYVAPLRANRTRYEAVGRRLGTPWWVVGIVHGLEAAFDFGRHLHNGDPLAARTVRQPAGRPASGTPPFAWEESAVDALRGAGLANLDGADTGAVLDRLERYNGLGYRRRGLPSPYLWSFTGHYRRGKYVADGRFDPDAVSRQPGAAAILLRLGEIERKKAPVYEPLTRPIIAPVFARETVEAELAFPTDARRAQEWLTLRGHPTAIDGIAGPATGAALAAFQKAAGLPESGAVDRDTWDALAAPMRAALAAAEPGADDIHAAALCVAEQHLAAGARELRHGGQGNRGPWVRLYMLGREGDAWPWCAGFASHVIGQAAAALGQAMPTRREVGVDALVAGARDDRRLLPEDRLATPAARSALVRPGSLFCLRRTATDWTHTGLVRSIAGDHFTTVEGNGNGAGGREGTAVVSVARSWARHDFISLT